MGLIVKDNGGGDYEKVPTGMFNAVCLRVFDLGLQESNIGGERVVSHKVAILWEIDEKKKDGTSHTVTQEYTASLNQKANLRKMLVSWRGKDFTQEELKGFDLDQIVGKGCTLNLVERTTKTGKTWTDVSTVSPKAKGVETLSHTTPVDFIPKWIQDKIDKQIRDETEKAIHKESMDDDIPF